MSLAGALRLLLWRWNLGGNVREKKAEECSDGGSSRQLDIDDTGFPSTIFVKFYLALTSVADEEMMLCIEFYPWKELCSELQQQDQGLFFRLQRLCFGQSSKP
jgi:hypothetical protein